MLGLTGEEESQQPADHAGEGVRESNGPIHFMNKKNTTQGKKPNKKKLTKKNFVNIQLSDLMSNTIAFPRFEQNFIFMLKKHYNHQ